MGVIVSAGGSFSVAFPAVTEGFTLSEVEFPAPVGTPVFGGIASGKILPGTSPMSCGVVIIDTLGEEIDFDSVVLKATLKDSFFATGSVTAEYVYGWRFAGKSYIDLQGWRGGMKIEEAEVVISDFNPASNFDMLGVLQTLTLPAGRYDEIRANLGYGLYNINIDPGLFLNAANFGYTFSQYWKTVSSSGGNPEECACEWTDSGIAPNTPWTRQSNACPTFTLAPLPVTAWTKRGCP